MAWRCLEAKMNPSNEGTVEGGFIEDRRDEGTYGAPSSLDTILEVYP